MVKPNVLVLTGYGINCDEETQFAFEKAGANAELVHVNDIIDGYKKLKDYQIHTFPGGFTGAGNALANRIRNHLWDDVRALVENDHLMLGICNGFQVMVNLGLLPGLDKKYGNRQVALVDNDFPRYSDRWVDLVFIGKSPWVKGLDRLSLPIAHGEGKFYADYKILQEIDKKNLVASRYVRGNVCNDQELRSNPNGSLGNIAGITDESGKLLGMMPHPERAIDFTQLPNWTKLEERYKREGKPIPTEGEGLQIFRNGVEYFK
jgi:phosphoribosylformylglycinamidine synthase